MGICTFVIIACYASVVIAQLLLGKIKYTMHLKSGYFYSAASHRGYKSMIGIGSW